MARHDRGYLREQRDRIISKRWNKYRRETPYPSNWWGEVEDWTDSIPKNRLSRHSYPLFGCGNPRCYCCHFDKLIRDRRVREEREWRKIEEVAW